ncbi:hypothetical protein C4R89_12355 [Clostridioides difficile]|nr:hypothetical protein [Clostridioides difficile]MDB0440324.1 hypothetical protein [Clostridioides difficile]
MIVVRNLNDLKNSYSDKVIDRYLYEYISNLIDKSENIIEKEQLIIMIGSGIDGRSGYKLKWKRNKIINRISYKEEFYILNNQGILLISKEK